MAALATNQLVDAGTKPAFVAPNAGGDTVEIGNGHDNFLVVRNTDATNAKTVTITPTRQTDYGVNLPPKVVNVPAVNGEAWIPLRQAYDNGVGDGRANVLVGGTGGVTGVTVAVVKV